MVPYVSNLTYNHNCFYLLRCAKSKSDVSRFAADTFNCVGKNENRNA